MTPEEHLEARAEQLVEAMRAERKRHNLIGWTDCRCHDRSWVAPLPMHGDQNERVAAWERHVESAVLNVVRTEREQITCPRCGGKGYHTPALGIRDSWDGPCDCIDGSVPGELLVVGLIGEQVGWRAPAGFYENVGRIPERSCIEFGWEPVYRIEREAPQ